MTTQVFAPGGYRFIPAVFQYSGGVAAEPGFQIERVVLPEPLPLAAGFERVEALIAGRGRPPTAFCACELRSPLPFSDDGFRAFNELYVETLAKYFDREVDPVSLYEHGLVRKGSPVKVLARGEVDKPLRVRAHAFSDPAKAKIEQAGGTAELVG